MSNTNITRDAEYSEFDGQGDDIDLSAGYQTKAKRGTSRKNDRDDIESLRHRVTALEAENRSLYEQAFILQQRLENNDVTEKERANFISTVAHELRTPLTSIKGYIDLILEGETGDINEIQREFLTIVGVNSNKLASIIGDLLDVSRLEAGRVVFKPLLAELISLAQEVVETVRPQFEAKGVRLDVSLPLGSSIEMLADRDRLLQALRILLSNSCFYTPPGGIVTFRVNRSPETKQVEIIVTDTSPAITSEEQPLVFTKFFRPETIEDEQAKKGTGLGLAIAKAIVEMHLGEITLESGAIRGNTYTIYLPVLNTSENEGGVDPMRVLPPAVLIVSQEDGFGQTVQKILSSEGFQVVMAHEREEVVSESTAWLPDLIIENGAELEKLADTSAVEKVARQIPLLTLSLSQLEQRAFKADALAVLVWPADESRVKAELLQATAGDLEGTALNEFINSQTVLVVSPQTDTLRAFDRILHEMGYSHIYRATMEADALALARRYRPNLLIVAVGELDSNEIELFEDLRTDPLLRSTPTVVFTNNENVASSQLLNYKLGTSIEDSIANGENGVRGGALNTLPKPMTRRRLLNVVRRLAKTI